jgi:hypothetical protein
VAATVGTLLAGGLLLVLRRRRDNQLRERPLGRRLRHPTATATRWEAALGSVAAHAPQVDEVVAAQFIGAAQAGQGRLIIIGQDGVEVTDRWGRRVGPDQTADSGPGALASLGQTEDGRLLLMDLEQPGGLVVTGPDAAERTGVIRALALDLACRRWTDGVGLVVVSDIPETAFADFEEVERIEAAQAGVERLGQVIAERRTHADGGELADWRADPNTADAWGPLVFCFTGDLAPDLATAIASAMSGPSLGVTAVWSRGAAADDAVAEPAILNLAQPDRAYLYPSGWVLRPPHLEPTSPIDELLSVTATRTTEAAWWDDAETTDASAAVFGFAGQEIGQDRPSTVALDGAEALTVREDEGVDVIRQGDAIKSGGPSCALEGTSRTAVRTLALGAATDFSGPTLRLLGPIELTGATGQRPIRAERSCLEYCAWLLEHPGATSTAMTQGLLVAEGTRRSNLSRLRTWLGRAADGTLYLPDAYSGRLYLDPAVTSDWLRLRLFIASGLQRTPTDRLIAALELVRGAPLADAAPGQWHWAEELRTDMVSVIRDLGVVLARRALADGDVDVARWATARALVAVGHDEQLLCRRIEVEHWAGNRPEVERLVGLITRRARQLGLDLLPGTITLLQEVIEGRPRLQSVGAVLQPAFAA